MAAWQIPLSVDQPKFETPLDAQNKALTLQQMAQGVNLQRQHQQENALKLQAMQEEQNDQQTLQQEFQNPKNFDEKGRPDFDKVYAAVSPKVRLKTAQALQKEHLDLLHQATLQDADTRLRTQLKNEAIGNSISGILQMPEDQKQPTYAAERLRLIKQGDITPEEYPEQYPGDESLKAHAAQVGFAARLQELATKRANEEKARQAAALAESRSAHEDVKTKAAEIQSGLESAARDHSAVTNQAEHDQWLVDLKTDAPEVYRRVANLKTFSPGTQQIIQNMALTADQRFKATKDPAEKNPTETSLALDVAAGKDPDATLEQKAKAARAELALTRLDQSKKESRPVNNFSISNPEQLSSTAASIANGDLAPGTVRALLRRTPTLISEIKKIDPKFDEAKIEDRYNTLKEFTSTSNSKAGGQLIALNTLIHHADLYQQVAESLKNGSFVPGNAAYNAVAKAFGSSPPTNAALVGRFLAGETGKVATGGVPAEGEINGILSNLSTSSSPQQIRDAGDTLLNIASGRAVPLIERAKHSNIDGVVQLIGPDAKEILQRRGFDPETMKRVGAGNTSTPSLPLELSASDVGKIYLNKGGKKIKITAVNPSNKKQFKFDEVP